MGGNAGACGEEGVTAARVCAHARPSAAQLARGEPARAVASAVPNPSGHCGFESPPGLSAPAGRGVRSGRRVSGKLSESRGAGTRSRGVSRPLQERPEESMRPPPPSRLHAQPEVPRSRRPRLRVAPVTPRPPAGVVWRFRAWASRPCAQTPGLPGDDPLRGLRALRETLGGERLQKQVADEAGGGSGQLTHLSGMETRALLLSLCRGG